MSEPRPVIGIVCAVEQARYAVWDTQCALLQLVYPNAIQRAGGMAVMIPPDPRLLTAPDEILARIDALILAGGADLEPAAYGQRPDPATEGTTPVRDTLELALITRAIERDMPVLGICRGLQILNVARGGTLIQHLPDVVGSDEHVRRKGQWEGNRHEVVITPGSLTEQAVGALRTAVFSHHHQAIGRLGEGLTVTALCPDDDVIEAVELTGSDYVLGVQWHPEVDADSGVIGSLVQRARAAALSAR